jgi:hypothetical protein
VISTGTSYRNRTFIQRIKKILLIKITKFGRAGRINRLEIELGIIEAPRKVVTIQDMIADGRRDLYKYSRGSFSNYSQGRPYVAQEHYNPDARQVMILDRVREEDRIRGRYNNALRAARRQDSEIIRAIMREGNIRIEPADEPDLPYDPDNYYYLYPHDLAPVRLSKRS